MDVTAYLHIIVHVPLPEGYSGQSPFYKHIHAKREEINDKIINEIDSSERGRLVTEKERFRKKWIMREENDEIEKEYINNE